MDKSRYEVIMTSYGRNKKFDEKRRQKFYIEQPRRRQSKAAFGCSKFKFMRLASLSYHKSSVGGGGGRGR